MAKSSGSKPSKSSLSKAGKTLATLDRLQDVGNALLDAARHRATASARADSEIGRLRS